MQRGITEIQINILFQESELSLASNQVFVSGVDGMNTNGRTDYH